MASSYTLDDHLRSEERRLRSMRGWLKVLPGLWTREKLLKAAQDVARMRAIVQSMTRAERAMPDSIDASRQDRIARGSGTDPEAVDRLVTWFLLKRRFEQETSEMRAVAEMAVTSEQNQQRLEEPPHRDDSDLRLEW